MKTKNIEQIWKNGRSTIEGHPEHDLDQVRKLTRKNFNRNKLVMLVYLTVYLLMQTGTVVIGFINLSGYRGNAGMTLVHCIIMTLSLAFFGYGIFLIRRITLMERFSDDLITALRKRISFYKTHYEIWLWIVSLTVILLTVSINALADNFNGTYRINNIIRYVALETGIFLFIYLAMKLAHLPLLKELRAHLSDLEKQTTESTTRFETRKRKWRWWVLAGWIIIAGLLLWAVAEGIHRYL